MFALIEKADGGVIDRVFQPASDTLARWADAVTVATFMIDGAIVVALCRAYRAFMAWSLPVGLAITVFPLLYLLPPLLYLLLALLYLWFRSLLPIARMQGSGRNALRLRFLPVRLAALTSFTAQWAGLLFTGISMDNLLFGLVQTLYLSCVYFASCDLRPPKPRKAKVPLTAPPAAL